MWRNLAIIGILSYVVKVKCQFYECEDDPGVTPEDGILYKPKFTWLGALQYIHVKNGTPHYFRVPRVVLINRQFVLSTAIDAAEIPHGFALGNVAFSEYERDEEECDMSFETISNGDLCYSATLLVPIADVLLHPEYKHFGATNSVALLKLIKPIRSLYMLPACLPFKDLLYDKERRQTIKKIIHIDYIADVPRDFTEEGKYTKKISILSDEYCDVPTSEEKSLKISSSRILCTTGCGFFSGAPSLVHEHTGHWSIVSLATGGNPCPDPLRRNRRLPPPHHIMIYPYVPWITVAISGKSLSASARDDPFGFIMPRTITMDNYINTWLGHWWMGGIRCWDRGWRADDLFMFYYEIFAVRPALKESDTIMYNLELHSGPDTAIACVKVFMPYQFYSSPKVFNLNSPVSKVVIPVLRTMNQYNFEVEAWGYNTTTFEHESDLSNETSVED